MKTIKINELSIKVCETLSDINAARFVATKEYILMMEAGIDMPAIDRTFRGFCQQFDEKSPSGMLKELYDFITGLQKVKDNEDAEQMLFALITVIEGEDVSSTDKTVLKEKLTLLSNAGLTQGIVREHVSVFHTAFRSR